MPHLTNKQLSQLEKSKNLGEIQAILGEAPLHAAIDAGVEKDVFKKIVNKIGNTEHKVENEENKGEGIKFIDARLGAYKQTALSKAAAWNLQDHAQILLEKGADPNIRDKVISTTPVLHAVWNGNFELADSLIEKGAKTKAKTIPVYNSMGEAFRGATIAHVAMLKPQEFIKYKLPILGDKDKGEEDFKIRDNYSYNRNKDYNKAIEFLEKHNIDILKARDKNGRSVLFYAESEGAIKALNKHFPNIYKSEEHICDKDGRNPFHYAGMMHGVYLARGVVSEDTTFLKDERALKAIVKLNSNLLENADNNKLIPFHTVVQREGSELGRRSSEASLAMIDLYPKAALAIGGDGGTVLHLGSYGGTSILPEIIKNIVKFGHNPQEFYEIKNNKGLTPLQCAAQRSDNSTFAEFLGGVACNYKGKRMVVRDRQYLEGRERALSGSNTQTESQKYYEQTLRMLIQNSKSTIFNLLYNNKYENVESKQDVNSEKIPILLPDEIGKRFIDGGTALHWAIEDADLEKAKNIIMHSKDVDSNGIINSQGETPLLALIRRGNYEIFNDLTNRYYGRGRNERSQKVDVTRKVNGRNFLHYAIEYGRDNFIKDQIWLFSSSEKEGKININGQDPETGQTPLHMAIDKGFVDIVELLIYAQDRQYDKAKIDFTIKDNNGLNPLQLARLSENDEIYGLISSEIRKRGIGVDSLAAIDAGRRKEIVKIRRGVLNKALELTQESIKDSAASLQRKLDLFSSQSGIKDENWEELREGTKRHIEASAFDEEREEQMLDALHRTYSKHPPGSDEARTELAEAQDYYLNKRSYELAKGRPLRVIKEDPVYSEFYNTVVTELGCTVVAIMLLKSGKLQAAKSDGQKMVNMGAKVAGSILGSIPVIGNFLSKAVDIGKDIYDAYHAHQEGKKNENVAYIAKDVVEATKLAKSAALYLTSSLEYQLKRQKVICDGDVESAKEVAKSLACYMITPMLKHMASGKIDSTKSTDEIGLELAEVVFTHERGFGEKLKEYFHENLNSVVQDVKKGIGKAKKELREFKLYNKVESIYKKLKGKLKIDNFDEVLAQMEKIKSDKVQSVVGILKNISKVNNMLNSWDFPAIIYGTGVHVLDKSGESFYNPTDGKNKTNNINFGYREGRVEHAEDMKFKLDGPNSNYYVKNSKLRVAAKLEFNINLEREKAQIARDRGQDYQISLLRQANQREFIYRQTDIKGSLESPGRPISPGPHHDGFRNMLYLRFPLDVNRKIFQPIANQHGVDKVECLEDLESKQIRLEIQTSRDTLGQNIQEEATAKWQEKHRVVNLEGRVAWLEGKLKNLLGLRGEENKSEDGDKGRAGKPSQNIRAEVINDPPSPKLSDIQPLLASKKKSPGSLDKVS